VQAVNHEVPDSVVADERPQSGAISALEDRVVEFKPVWIRRVVPLEKVARTTA
jgi:hypothetical protein